MNCTPCLTIKCKTPFVGVFSFIFSMLREFANSLFKNIYFYKFTNQFQEKSLFFNIYVLGQFNRTLRFNYLSKIVFMLPLIIKKSRFSRHAFNLITHLQIQAKTSFVIMAHLCVNTMNLFLNRPLF